MFRLIQPRETPGACGKIVVYQDSRGIEGKARLAAYAFQGRRLGGIRRLKYHPQLNAAAGIAREEIAPVGHIQGLSAVSGDGDHARPCGSAVRRRLIGNARPGGIVLVHNQGQ